MPPDHRRIRAWLRPPRNLFLLLAVLTAGSAAALGWLGWELLRQEGAAEARRAQDQRADRLVQAFDRLLGDADEHLTRLAETRGDAPADASHAPSADGLIVVVTATSVQPSNGSGLIFSPLVAARPEPSDALFAEGHTMEYGGNPRQAIDLYRRLTRSADPAVRAAALLRVARVLRTSGQPDAALHAYGEMATLDDAPVIGMPAGPVARAARADVLAGLELREEASREATALLGDLTRGRWPLTRGQFEHLIDEAVRLGATGGPSPLDVAVASAVSDLWTTWRTQPTPRGSKLVREGDVPLLVMWRTSADRLAAWVVEPRALLKRVADPGPDISLTDAEGFAVAGSADDPDGRVTRAIAETRLPWSVHVGRDGSPAAAPGLTRGRLVLAGLVVMLGFLAAGSYFIGRAVKQEMDLARLQSDFVSAVSHEFRTPLAAMRQLSELLAAGRVPLAERRQQYYDSLAGESRRLQRLVENLLNFGRFEAGARPYQLEPLDARALVEQVVAEFQSSLPHPACPIEVHGSGDPVALLADREAMALALHNLIDNAVKYSGAGRTVRVEWARRDDRVALSVRDEGPGVAADERARIFQKFVRGAAAAAANVRGTGVGLAMVRRIALAHGGTVGVSSEPGAGSCFTITLPVSVPREKHLLSG